MTPTTALAAVPRDESTLALPAAGFLDLRSLPDAIKAAEYFAKSELVPKNFFGKPADIVIAWQYGAEVGLSPMASLRYIAPINGKPGLYGDGFLAAIQKHPGYRGHKEWYDAETKTAHCVFRRRGPDGAISEHAASFSETDAKVAGLWGKQGPWTQYPKRQMQMRARGFSGRDAFADALGGVSLAEELMDVTDVETSTGTVEVAMPRRKSAAAEPTITKAEEDALSAAEEAAEQAAAAAALAARASQPAAEPAKPTAPAPSGFPNTGSDITGTAFTGIVKSVTVEREAE